MIALLVLGCPDHPESRPPVLPSAAASPAEIEALKRELARRAQLDQDARRGPPPWTEVDTDNTAWLKATVGQYGWPRESLVGTAAAHDAWLLLQHTQDHDFLVHQVDQMEPLAASGEIAAKDYALTLDRVRMYQGQPQIYGSQLQVRETAIRPCPFVGSVVDVDARRRAIGLEPMAANAARIAKRHHGIPWTLEPWESCVSTPAAPVATPQQPAAPSPH